MDNQKTAALLQLDELKVQPQSLVVLDEAELGFAWLAGASYLALLAPSGSGFFEGFEGRMSAHDTRTLMVGQTNSRNLAKLRTLLPWLHPQPLGLRTSAGMGDRIGLATPGHVRAVRDVGGQIAPIFPQQSIREMKRTRRTPTNVMDDAVWGVFSEGWRSAFGADADHLKTTDDIDSCAAVGFTFYTVDPGEYVDDSAETANASALRGKLEALPWDRLEDNAEALVKRYTGKTFEIENYKIQFNEGTIRKAAVKYGRAVAHINMMYRHLVGLGIPHEMDISVDETENVTSHAEHVYIANELKRLGVQWVSLAPRYIGRFEKGIDYIGDVEIFEGDFGVHAAIARHFGPYKLSLHSGSDKFSIYPASMRQTRGLVHLKTAGTSYLEALRTVAVIDSALFRAIYSLSRDRFETDRATYHISGRLDRAPLPQDVPDAGLPALLDQIDVRQILHVAFGSVLTSMGDSPRDIGLYDQLMSVLTNHPNVYAANVEAHFMRHLAPFSVKQ